MGTGSDILDLILFAVGFLAIGAVACAPQLLASLGESRVDAFERDLRQRAELDRKIAIAEAAAAARARGEPFVPPEDYDR